MARTAICQTRRLALRGISVLVLPPAVALVAAVVFVALRLAFAAHGDLSRFVLAGDSFATRSAVPHDLFVFNGHGYDGQFFYRLGRNPADMTETFAGLRIDDPLRFARPGYPLLAWLLSGAGHPAALTVTLVIVNVAALALAAFSGGLLARDAGRHPAWGLLVAGYWAVRVSAATFPRSPRWLRCSWGSSLTAATDTGSLLSPSPSRF